MDTQRNNWNYHIIMIQLSLEQINPKLMDIKEDFERTAEALTANKPQE